MATLQETPGAMNESPEKMHAVASVMLVLAFVAVGFRFYARRIKKSGVSWDDLFIVLATVRSLKPK